MRLTTLLALLAALVAVPAARIGGLIGGASTPRSVVSPRGAPSTTAPTAPQPGGATSTIPAPVIPLAPPPEPTVRILPSLSWTVAMLHPGGVDVFADATATGPSLHLGDQTEFGNRRVVPVISQRETWLEVRLPVRPNNAVGWIREQDVDVATVPDRITVNLSTRQLAWYHSLGQAAQASVAIGSVSSPTPRGEYYVTDVIPSSGSYGPWILALNGHSDTFTDFEGGDARLAIHGTDDPGSIGGAASNGCVRVANDFDAQLAAAIRPGTVVEIG